MAGIVPPHPPMAGPESAAAFRLPARLDLPAAAPLTEALLAHRRAPLRLDAGEVAHLGGLCLQVLLAAAESWRANGAALQVAPRSEAFIDALDVFAVTPGMIEAEGESALDAPALSDSTAAPAAAGSMMQGGGTWS